MIFHHICRLLLLTIVTLYLSGCWDAKIIEEMYYVIGIGIDYDTEVDEYICYTQYVDFNAVATGEGKPAEEIPPWIGRGRGKTINLAFNHLYEEAQHRIFWGHVSALIFTEEALKAGIDKAFDALNRYPEFRYTPWVFGTRDSLMDIFSVTGMFQLSPLQTNMHHPMYTYEQRSILLPYQLNHFVRKIHEPGTTVILSNIDVSDLIYYEAKDSKEKYRLNGGHLIDNYEYKGWLDSERLMGYRWIDKHTFRSPLVIEENGDALAIVSLINPDTEVTYTVENQKVFFEFDITFEGNVVEILGPITQEQIIQKAEEGIKEEIRQTYQEGLQLNVDVFSLREHLYREDIHLWKQLIKKDPFLLDEHSLKKIHVEVNLMNSGKMKLIEKRIYQPRLWDRVKLN